MSFSADPQTVSPWPAPRVSAPLDADVRVPGSKSLTNRYLVLAALADGPSRLRAPLHSRDTALMVQSLRALGATVTEIDANHLFYLMARGIDEKTARGLLVKAFVAEVIEELEDEAVVTALEAMLDEWFAAHG